MGFDLKQVTSRLFFSVLQWFVLLLAVVSFALVLTAVIYYAVVPPISSGSIKDITAVCRPAR